MGKREGGAPIGGAEIGVAGRKSEAIGLAHDGADHDLRVEIEVAQPSGG